MEQLGGQVHYHEQIQETNSRLWIKKTLSAKIDDPGTKQGTKPGTLCPVSNWLMSLTQLTIY